jgi:hypothetical protein
MDVRTISPELLIITFLEGLDLILEIPPVLATQVSSSKREHTPPGLDVGRHIIRLVLHLFESQQEGIGYIWNSYELHPSSANTFSLLSPGTLLDASKCGLGAYHNTRNLQKLLIQDTLAAEHACLQPIARPVEAAM